MPGAGHRRKPAQADGSRHRHPVPAAAQPWPPLPPLPQKPGVAEPEAFQPRCEETDNVVGRIFVI